MSTRTTFTSGNLELEGMLNRKKTDRGVVITHPHPLYGGDMNNPVVNTIAAVYERKGISTLTFNFRGVGRSEGSYDAGIGEADDVRAAVSYLLEKGIRRIDLAGYSFGAWVIATVPLEAPWGERLVMVSPPVALMDMPASMVIPGLDLVITGDRDDIAPPDLIKNRLPGWCRDTRFTVLSGADHFYSGALDRLERALSGQIQ